MIIIIFIVGIFLAVFFYLGYKFYGRSISELDPLRVYKVIKVEKDEFGIVWAMLKSKDRSIKILKGNVKIYKPPMEYKDYSPEKVKPDSLENLKIGSLVYGRDDGQVAYFLDVAIL
jgi:hypothetical protein